MFDPIPRSLSMIHFRLSPGRLGSIEASPVFLDVAGEGRGVQEVDETGGRWAVRYGRPHSSDVDKHPRFPMGFLYLTYLNASFWGMGMMQKETAARDGLLVGFYHLKFSWMLRFEKSKIAADRSFDSDATSCFVKLHFLKSPSCLNFWAYLNLTSRNGRVQKRSIPRTIFSISIPRYPMIRMVVLWRQMNTV